MNYVELKRQSVKLIGIFAIVAIFVNIAAVPVAEGKINEKKAEKTPIETKNCLVEKGVKFESGDDTRLSTEEIDNLLTGNTIMSISEKYGVYTGYYPTNKKSVGWFPKKIDKEEGWWTRGTVTFENDKYCRQWKRWSSGKKFNVGRFIRETM